MGAKIVEKVHEATHLVCDRLLRTEKMLLSINRVKFILSWKWLDESMRAQRWLDEAKYTLTGKTKEDDFVSLDKSLKNARENPGLLQGVWVLSTPSTKPSHDIQKRQAFNALF